MKKRVKKLIVLLMTAIALSWVVPQGTIDVLAEYIYLGNPTPETVEISTNSADTYIFYSGASHTLIVKDGVTLSGKVDMQNSGKLVNNGIIAGEILSVDSGDESIINKNTGTIQSVLSISGGKISNSGTLGSVTLAAGGWSGPEFEMDGGTVNTLTVEAGTASITGGSVNTLTATTTDNIQLGGDTTIGTLNADGAVEILGTPVITEAKASNFTGDGIVKIVDSVELGNENTTAKLKVFLDTKITVMGGNDVGVTIVDSNNNTIMDETIPAGTSGKTPVDLYGKMVSFATETGHMSATDTLTTDRYWPGASTGVVTYKADNGYYFPENYGKSDVSCNGKGKINITRVDVNTIQVSYTLSEDETDDVTLTLPAATPKANQEAPTDLVGEVKKITGTTTLMEYAQSRDADDSAWSPCTEGTTEISTAGTWYVRYKETEDKLSGQPADVLVLTEGTGSITVEDICYGKQPLPIVNSATNGTENVRIEYKKKSAADNTYTTVVPTAVGDYTARAIFAGQGLYDGVVATDDFSITFMRLAKAPYTISAEKGNNGFYKSIVTVVAERGYLLAEKLDGTYVSSLTYDTSKGAFSLFAVKQDTGEKSNAIGLAGFKVDRVAPSIDAVDAQTYYTDTVEFAITDDNLESVSVNGKKVKVDTTGKIAFPSNGGVANYEVVIADRAGNTRRVSFKVAAKWTKSGVVPTGQAVLLTTENAYKLGSGTWKVNGDSTSYNGNQSFYVGSEGQYVFTGN